MMHRHSILKAILLAPALFLQVASADDATATTTTTSAVPACTISNSDAGGIGGFYDLRPDIAARKEEGKPHPYKGTVTTDYKVNGFDYKHNFTLNICAAVVKTPEDVRGVGEKLWKNISAYYSDGDYTYSLG
jgi:cation-dependent mannose-6-phosphate receptor